MLCCDPVIPQVLLRRVASLPDGMAGVLMWVAPSGPLPLCVTLEDPWRNNAVGESCIPAGTYRVRQYHSPKFGSTFIVNAVPGRSLILLHWGNTHFDTRGCVLLGRNFGVLDNKLDIGESRVAFEALRAVCVEKNIREFDLTIEDCWGGRTVVAATH